MAGVPLARTQAELTPAQTAFLVAAIEERNRRRNEARARARRRR